MIRARLKTLLLRFLYVGILILLLSPLYMYFSYDVEKLNTLYPHVIDSKSEIPEYELRPGKPKNWSTLKEISPYAKGAIVISEDWGFYQHEGIDLEQMKAAFNEMLDSRRFRGASTITQQMVKNVFLSQDRTLWRKIHELILAQKVEKVLSKEKILEVYLNCIEFGPDIYGIKSASLHYFKKPPISITPREGAFFAMMLPSPKRYYISFKEKRLTSFALFRINTTLKKMRMGKMISPSLYEAQKNSRFSWEKR